MIKIRKNLSIFLIALGAVLLCNPAFADHHDHHHDNDDFSFGLYLGGGGPYYYPYYPYGYYYPRNYVVISPSYSKPAAKAPVTADSVKVMKAQVELTSKGYYNGSVDGILGPQTSAAIKAFQQNKGLAQTGQLDDDTLKALGVPKS